MTDEELKELVEKSLKKRTISGCDGWKLLINLGEVDEFVDDIEDHTAYKRSILKDDGGNLYSLDWQAIDGQYEDVFDCEFYRVRPVEKVITDYEEYYEA